MIVPPIGSKGKFKFTEPFNSTTYEEHEYKVVSIRGLIEIYNNNEKPLDTIYKSVGLTENDFKHDLDNHIDIAVLATGGNEYLYVPVNRIISIPLINGIKYQEIMLAASLGMIPVSMDISILKEEIADLIYHNFGITTDVKSVPTSAVTLKTITEDSTFRKLLTNKRTVKKGYKTRYYELIETHNKTVHQLEQLEICMRAKL